MFAKNDREIRAEYQSKRKFFEGNCMRKVGEYSGRSVVQAEGTRECDEGGMVEIQLQRL
jgi:hypothetical protein